MIDYGCTAIVDAPFVDHEERCGNGGSARVTGHTLSVGGVSFELLQNRTCYCTLKVHVALTVLALLLVVLLLLLLLLLLSGPLAAATSRCSGGCGGACCDCGRRWWRFVFIAAGWNVIFVVI